MYEGNKVLATKVSSFLGGSFVHCTSARFATLAHWQRRFLPLDL